MTNTNTFLRSEKPTSRETPCQSQPPVRVAFYAGGDTGADVHVHREWVSLPTEFLLTRGAEATLRGADTAARGFTVFISQILCDHF